MIGWLKQHEFLTGGLTLMMVGTLLAALRTLPWKLANWVLTRFMISVEVPDRDPAFRWLRTWVAEQRYARRARRLSLTTEWSAAENGDEDADTSAAGGSSARFVLSPAPGTHVMSYRGRLLILQRARRDLESGGALSFQETLTLQILGGDRAMVDELLNEAYLVAQPRVPGVNILTARYDNWYVSSWRPKRPVASIVLADDLLEDLITDMRTFRGAGVWYATRGVPHRRGYLLYGPPGNGKTTLVIAAAGALDLSVAVLNLSNKAMSDESLRTLVDALPVGTLLLIEDVDCAFSAKRKASDETGITLSGLLNALDGVSSREGRLLFLTTNHPERLDPALVRPGRVDRSIHLGNTTSSQARRLFAWFYAPGEPDPEIDRLSREFAARVGEARVSMAAIQEHLLRHRTDPEAAVLDVDFDRLESQPAREETERSWPAGVEPPGSRCDRALAHD